MGMSDKFDELKDKAKDAASGHGDQAKEGVDSAADQVDEKTGGRFGSQVDKGADAAKDRIDDVDQGS